MTSSATRNNSLLHRVSQMDHTLTTSFRTVHWFLSLTWSGHQEQSSSGISTTQIINSSLKTQLPPSGSDLKTFNQRKDFSPKHTELCPNQIRRSPFQLQNGKQTCQLLLIPTSATEPARTSVSTMSDSPHNSLHWTKTL